MRIGIYPALEGSAGGVYQYSLSTLRALIEWQRETDTPDEVVIFKLNLQKGDTLKCVLEGLPEPPENWSLAPLIPPRPVWRRRLEEVAHLGVRLQWGEIVRRVQSKNSEISVPRHPDRISRQYVLDAWLRQLGIELMLYPAPFALAIETQVPFIMAVHDLQHRLQPQFPEVSADGEWEVREHIFRNAARYARALLVDSQTGLEDLLHFYGEYGLTQDRVRVLPFVPAHYLAVDVPLTKREQVHKQFSLPDLYVFYPAQFWPHKNHISVVRALGLLHDEGLKVNAVFCGSHAGEKREACFREMMGAAEHMGIAAQIHYLDYVSDDAMSALYAEATALVMPTFFGPTNIPVLEAWSFGCPVLTSDIRGIREQCGDAAILADPNSPSAIAAGIRQLWMDSDLRETLATRGRMRLSAYTPGDFRRRLVDAIKDAAQQQSK